MFVFTIERKRKRKGTTFDLLRTTTQGRKA